MPTTSPAKASSAMERSWAKKNCGAESVTGLPVRTSFARMPRWSLPEQTRMKAMRSRWFGSMFAWILKTNPVILASSAVTVRVAAACARGEGANSAIASMRSLTPKSLSALPNRTGVRWPSRKACLSKGFRPSTARWSSSRASARSCSGRSPATRASSGPETAIASASLPSGVRVLRRIS